MKQCQHDPDVCTHTHERAGPWVLSDCADWRAILQVQVLRMLDEGTMAARKSHKAADTSASFHRVLPALLAAASAPDRAVRAAALDALQAASASVKAGSSHADGTLTGRPSRHQCKSMRDLLRGMPAPVGRGVSTCD